MDKTLAQQTRQDIIDFSERKIYVVRSNLGIDIPTRARGRSRRSKIGGGALCKTVA
jgi:hypothetical protein